MSAVDRPSRRSIYLAVLAANEPSPFLPEVGRRAGQRASAGDARAPDQRRMRIDFAGIGQRILRLDVPPGDYGELAAGPAGTVFYSRDRRRRSKPTDAATPARSAARFDVKRSRARDDRSSTAFARTRSRRIERSCSTQPARARRRAGASSATDKPAQGRRRSGQRRAARDAGRSARRMGGDLQEAWRNQRDYFYDAKMHGADWNAVSSEVRAARRVRGPSRGSRRISSRRPAASSTSATRTSPAPATSPTRHAGRRRPARRRLHGRERTLPHSAHLHRRELESRICARRSAPRAFRSPTATTCSR